MSDSAQASFELTRNLQYTRAPVKESCTFSSGRNLISAKRYIAPMRGGTSSHLVQCTDGEYYVVKFAHNLQGPMILANELLASQLADLMGLPVPRYAVVKIGAQFIASSPELAIHWRHQTFECSPGLAFASHYQSLVGDEHPHFARPLSSLPPGLMAFVDNRPDFYGMLVFDKWVCNTDSRQVVFTPLPTPPHFHVSMIDNGYCFNAHNWDFPDAPIRGLCRERYVYEPFRGMEAFKGWLARLEMKIDLTSIEYCAAKIPPRWYGRDLKKLRQLLARLEFRRTQVANLLEETIWAIAPHLCRDQARRWPLGREANKESRLDAGRPGGLPNCTHVAPL